MTTQQLAEKTIKKILVVNPQTPSELSKIKRALSKTWEQPLPKNSSLLKAYRKLINKGEIEQNSSVEYILITRKVRTLSGVAPVTVLTKPFPCPGKCVYCPTEPNMPKSYLSNEPAAMRAVLNNFDAFDQVTNRLRSLTENGHTPDKIDILILGGTWSSYPKDYQKEFILDVYRAANSFNGIKDESKTLAEAQQKNESTQYRIIGLCIETRPDHVCEPEIIRWREYGVTRVQLGAQHLDDEVQRITKRGHYTDALITATKMIKDAGFKIDYHIMQNLPGSSPEKDLWCVKEIVTNQNFQPDQIKIYPTIVNEYAELYDWFKEGRYETYTDEVLANLILQIKQLIPYYIRINRIIRDFPGEAIIAGNKITNLREYISVTMKERGLMCKCIRCRESKHDTVERTDATLFNDEYDASDGKEYFINYASPDRSKLYAFCRLRLPGEKNKDHFLKDLRGAAIIREIHTVGKIVSVDKTSQGEPQHIGFGTALIKEAENIAKKDGYDTIAVIAGVGVRKYFYNLGYTRADTYVTKKLSR